MYTNSQYTTPGGREYMTPDVLARRLICYLTRLVSPKGFGGFSHSGAIARIVAKEAEAECLIPAAQAEHPSGNRGTHLRKRTEDLLVPYLDEI